MTTSRTIGLAVLVAALASASIVGARPFDGARGESGPRKPFPPAGSKMRPAPERTVDLIHTKLAVRFDFEKKAVSGTAEHTFRALRGPLDSIELHAEELTCTNARVDGTSAAIERRGGEVVIRLPASANPSDASEHVLAVDFSATPRTGLYFVVPDKAFPDRPKMVWSQGEAEDNRHWFPSWDFPNDRATSEMLATVPAAMTAVSNGKLLQTTDAPGGSRTFHWKESVPHVNYLISVAVGEFDEVTETAAGVPLSYYVPKGRKGDIARSFGKTGAMIARFEQLLGTKYPYEKYAQTCVLEFIYGGMENVSATTLTDTTLHDERAHLDFSSDPLVAHELAHQWFGDLLTCRDWPHAWLNEGFATFMDLCFAEHDLGRDEYLVRLHHSAGGYIGEDQRYRRPIVPSNYGDPDDLFDSHTYSKGAWVLHMLRAELGDEAFWRGIRAYLAKNRDVGLVETDDLRRALEETTGRNLGAFFERWLKKAGYPELKVKVAWDQSKKQVVLTVAQTQTADDDTPAVFEAEVPVELVVGKKTLVHKAKLAAREHTFTWPCDERPRYVRFDPGQTLLKTVEYDVPRDMLAAQLKTDADPVLRIRAAQALGKLGTEDALKALASVVTDKAHWGVHAEVAAQLATFRTDAARNVLISALATWPPKSRKAAAAALGSFRDDAVASAALESILAKDPSYFVAAEAAASIGRIRQKSAFDVLSSALSSRGSHTEVIRARSMAGLAELEDERGIALATEWSAYGKPFQVRTAAAATLARLLDRFESRRDERRTLIALLPDPQFRVRFAAVDALADLGDRDAVVPIERLRRTDPDGRVKRKCADALDQIQSDRRGRFDRLRAQVESLEEQVRTLKKPKDRPEGSKD